MPTHPETHDAYKIDKAADFSDEYMHFSSQFPSVQKPFAVFVNNMNQVKNIGLLPMFLTAATAINEAHRVATLYESGFKMGDPRLTRNHPQFEETLWNSLHEKRIEATMRYMEGLDEEKLKSIGTFGLQALASGQNQGVREGIKSILQAMIVDSCTAFEVLSEDLFEVSKKTDASIIPGPKEVGFRSRGRIREAYKRWMKDPLIDVALLDSAFDAIFLLRNVLVHCSGIADHDFMEGVKRTPLLGMYSVATDGDKIIVRGEVVRLLLDEYIRSVLSFVRALDSWTRNFQKP